MTGLHTQEPWRIDEDRTNALNNNNIIIYAPDTPEETRIAMFYDEPHMAGGDINEVRQNVERTLMALEACQGLSVDTLMMIVQRGGFKRYLEMSIEVAKTIHRIGGQIDGLR